jgi:hypothetical protein
MRSLTVPWPRISVNRSVIDICNGSVHVQMLTQAFCACGHIASQITLPCMLADIGVTFSDVTIRLFSHRSGYRSDLPLQFAIQIQIQIRANWILDTQQVRNVSAGYGLWGQSLFGAHATAVNTEKRVEYGRGSIGVLTWAGARRTYRHWPVSTGKGRNGTGHRPVKPAVCL